MKYLLASLVAVGLIGGSYGLNEPLVRNGEKHENHLVRLSTTKDQKEEQDVDKVFPRIRNPATGIEVEKKRVYFAPTRESSNSESKDLPGVR